MLIDDLIELAPHEESVYRHVKKKFCEYEGPLDVVVDIGSHFGSFALLAARAGAKKVIAVEPHPVNLIRLVQNVNHSKWNNRITILPMAAWVESSKKVKLYGLGPSTKNSLVYRSNCSSVPATTISLMDIIKSVGHVDVLKMSIEGAEANIFSDVDTMKALENVEYVDIQFSRMDSDNEFAGRSDRVLINFEAIQDVFYGGGFQGVKITGNSQRVAMHRMDRPKSLMHRKSCRKHG